MGLWSDFKMIVAACLADGDGNPINAAHPLPVTPSGFNQIDVDDLNTSIGALVSTITALTAAAGRSNPLPVLSKQVTFSGESQTLADLLGAALPTNLTCLLLVPDDSTLVYFAIGGAASATTGVWSEGYMNTAADMRFLGTAGKTATLVLLTPDGTYGAA